MTALAPSIAGAAPTTGKAQRFTLSSASTTARFCATRSVSGVGTDRQRYVARAGGFLTARLSGGSESSDWDLAIVDAETGKALDGSAGTTSYEVATAAVRKGQALSLQACRHAGAARSVRLSTALTKVDWSAMAKELKGQKVVLARVKLKSRDDVVKLSKLGLDKADHPAGSYWDVQLYSDAEQARLRESGLEFTVREADVLAKAKRDRAAERRATRGRASRAGRSTPTNRTSYRTLPEVQEELRALAAQNPGLVKLVVLPRRSIEGREILGVEIAEGVDRTDDGRPTFVNLGNHHAREWPSVEAPLEFAYDLIRRYRAGEPRWSNVVRTARTVVIPSINVDGFSASINSERNTLADPDGGQGGGFEQAMGVGAYKRKNCSTGDPATEREPCILRTRQAGPPGEPPAPFGPDALAYRDLGVDLNRNYGEQWGGPGTEHTRLGTYPAEFSFGITFHGPERFSEPEVQAFREWSRDRTMSVMIGNHTYTGLILRPPATSVDGPAEDELAMKALGDAMAAETEYVSQYGYQLYDTTGSLDDYTYGALGAFSYTPEIGKENFHPNYVTGFIPEYDGRLIEDPDTGSTTGNGKRGGLREAYLLAAETAANADSHSVLRGTAPAGRTLTLTRDVYTTPSTAPDDNGFNDQPDTPLPERRTLTTTVPASGQFEWHILPSRQPGKTTGAESAPWTLTCSEGGTVRETRSLAIERSQAIAMDLACGQAAAAPTTPAATCTEPNGFRSVGVKRTGRSLRISFSKRTRNAVTVEVFQTSKGRRIVNAKRVARFRNRQRSFTWSGRKTSGKKTRVARGVYFVRFRVTDDAKKVDTRRIVVAKRSNGRFYKKGKFLLENTCP